MAYDPNNFTSEYDGLSKPGGQIASTQELTTPSFFENKHMVRAKEVRGGVHFVKYKGLLAEDTLYDGIMSSRREEGMLAMVKFLDDDTPHWGLYKLVNYPGNDFNTIDSDWQLQAGSTLTPNNATTVADLAARDALTPADNDYVNVSDARILATITAITKANPGVITVDNISDFQEGADITITGVDGMVEIPDGDYKVGPVNGLTFELHDSGDTPIDTTAYTDFIVDVNEVKLKEPFSQSFIYDGSNWLTIYGAGGVDPLEVQANSTARHSQNTDTQLQTTGGPLTADQIKSHMDNLAKHRQINDSSLSGNADELYSSLKINELADAGNQFLINYTYSKSQIDSKVSTAAQGIERTFVDIAARDAADDVALGTLALVDSDRGVYKFNGSIGSSGPSFWDFQYYLDVIVNDASADWNSPLDNLAVSQLAIENRIQAVVNAINSVDEVVPDIAARDALGTPPLVDGYNVWVIDASADPTVDSGWALYKYLDSAGPGFVKEAEQESIDLDLSVFIRKDAGTQEGQILMVDENDEFVPTTPTNKYLDTVGPIVLTEAYCFENYPLAKLEQVIESDFQLATRTQGGWSIVKKDPNYSIQQELDLSDPNIWDIQSQTLNIQDYVGADILNIINFNSVYPTTFTITLIEPVLFAQVIVHLTTGLSKYLNNGDVIRLENIVGAVGPTGLNYSNGNQEYTIDNIDYDNDTFELLGTDGINYTAYTSGGSFSPPAGFAPKIKKIIGLPERWSISLSASSPETLILGHTDKANATSNDVVSNTKNDIIIEGSDEIKNMVTIMRQFDVNVGFVPFSESIKEQNIVSNIVEEEVTGTYTFDVRKARKFDLTMLGNTTFTVPTLNPGESLVFTVDLRGAFSATISNATPVPNSEAYSGSVTNRLSFECSLSETEGATQVNKLRLENLSA